jgi:phenylacetate-CoA ligase
MVGGGWEGRVDERLRAVVASAYRSAPAVRAKLDRAGVLPEELKGVADLERLPVTTKDELVQLQAENPPFGGFCTVPLGELSHVFVSPGPLYEPGMGGNGFGSAWFFELLAAFGVAPGERALNTFAYQLAPAGLALDQALRAFGLTVVPGGTGNSEVQVRALRDLGISLFCGTPGFLTKLLDRADELGYRPGAELRLRHAVLGAEAFPADLREELFGRGIAPIQTYGTADVGLIAAECPAGRLHVSDDAALEIVDPGSGRRLPPGETGEVVVTPFNELYPLLRFGTGDLAHVGEEPCPCGRPSPVLSRLTGRVGRAVKVRGMFLHPHQVDEALATVAGVSRYQVAVRRQGRRDELVVRMEEGRDGPVSLEDLGARAQSLWRVRPDRFETVPAGALGDNGQVLVDERPWDG